MRYCLEKTAFVNEYNIIFTVLMLDKLNNALRN